MVAGRPTVMTTEILAKLEHAFSLGCSDVEACLYADIGTTALYDYQKNNPDFTERKQQLKENPVLKARTNVMADIESGDVDTSKWLLERKKKDEFGTKQSIDIGGQANGVPIMTAKLEGEQLTALLTKINDEL